MSQNMQTLLTVAAELRAAGASWEAVGDKVNRRPRTCQKWPNRFGERWNNIYRSAQQRRFEETSNEALTILRNLMRDEDRKTRLRSIEVWLRCGAGAYGLQGALAGERPLSAKEEADREKWQNAQRVEDQTRERFNYRRAREGLPPLTDDEFYDEWIKEMTSRPEPIPVYFDADGNSCAPPADPQEPPESSKWSGGSVVLGMLLFATAVAAGSMGGLVTHAGPRHVMLEEYRPLETRFLASKPSLLGGQKPGFEARNRVSRSALYGCVLTDARVGYLSARKRPAALSPAESNHHAEPLMKTCHGLAIVPLVALALAIPADGQAPKEKEKRYLDPIDVKVPHISTDKSVQYDYDIAYVRAPRAGDKIHKRFFTDFSSPVTMEPGADLMLLHPFGSEEVLVKGGDGSVTDPVVSLDGEWIYYTHIHNLVKASQWSPPRQGADIYKINVKSRKIVRLTNQKFSPNTGAANWSKDFRTPEKDRSHFETGVYNMGSCPLPGGRIAFTSNRDGFRPAKGYPAIALQLFVMDDRDTDIGDDEVPTNLEKIGHLNISGALHPVALKDGRILYCTLESQGIRGDILWGIWTINPDGTRWAPFVSAFDPGGAPNGFHFQAQLSDGSVIVEEYYNQNNSGFGAFIKIPPTQPDGYPAFGPGYMNDPANKPWRYGRFDNGNARWYRMPFMPTGSVSLTPFSHGFEGPADTSIRGDKDSPKVGKFTHPSAAPDNNLLTCYSPGPVNHQYTFLPQLDGGIYLIKNGDVVDQPAQMRLIKNDPNYNECWPRAVVPYQRIYGMKEPKNIVPLVNDGKHNKHLPEGTPFGLVGTSSFYKRESYPNGVVPKGSVTATFAGGNDPWKGLGSFTSHGNGMQLNWHNQGADSALYSNDEIHAVRILAMEPTTDRKGANSGRRFYNHAQERLRILGEIPLRKFVDGKQPLDPDGSPDTSFLAKIPADTAFTFQTLDKDGMVLNMAQTWHQLRPGEIRTDCGGCHAHSQKPTDFNKTLAAKDDYKVWDLVNSTPLLTDKARDESKVKWDEKDASGLRALKEEVLNVEYFRDVQPILKRSCVACHTSKEGKEPAGNLDLDADGTQEQVENHGKFPGTYYRLAMDERAKYGYKPIGWDSWGSPNASRYIRKFQSRRSLLTWKIFGKRLDGFSNDDHPSEAKPGDLENLVLKGQKVDLQKNRSHYDLDFTGSQMPPPDAVKAGKVQPLSDEDRRTLVRWIDLGCPIDLDFDPAHPEKRGYGWMLDDNRPIVSLTLPARTNAELSRVLIGMHDYGTGLDMTSFRVVADFPVDGTPAGENLAAKFKPLSQGVWEMKLAKPIADLPKGRLIVEVKDKQGSVSRIERTFSVSKQTARR